MPLPVSPNKCMFWKFFYLKIFVHFIQSFQPFFFCCFWKKPSENSRRTAARLRLI